MSGVYHGDWYLNRPPWVAAHYHQLGGAKHWKQDWTTAMSGLLRKMARGSQGLPTCFRLNSSLWRTYRLIQPMPLLLCTAFCFDSDLQTSSSSPGVLEMHESIVQRWRFREGSRPAHRACPAWHGLMRVGWCRTSNFNTKTWNPGNLFWLCNQVKSAEASWSLNSDSILQLSFLPPCAISAILSCLGCLTEVLREPQTFCKRWDLPPSRKPNWPQWHPFGPW